MPTPGLNNQTVVAASQHWRQDGHQDPGYESAAQGQSLQGLQDENGNESERGRPVEYLPA